MKTDRSHCILIVLVFALILSSGCAAPVVGAVVVSGEVAATTTVITAITNAGVTLAAATVTAILAAGFTKAMITADLANGIIWADVAHAEAQHGAGIVDKINACLEKNPLGTVKNISNGRIARICADDDNRFYVRIDEDGGPNENSLVTAFKNKAKVLQDVLDYLANRGYQ